jgi:CRP-like cAMP-binding protein
VKIDPLELLVHFGNVLLLISYSVRSMLWLRWFAVASALTVVPYYVAQEKVLWPPVFWALVFTAINLSMQPRQFLSLVLIGAWKDASAGDQVLTERERVSAVCVPISGAIDVRRQGQRLMTLRPGYLIGTALALTDAPSPVSASFSESGRYIEWPVSQLRIFSDRNPQLRATLQGMVNQDLARKLEAALSPAPATPT